MKKLLWKFSDEQGSFTCETANQINTLYLPLCNELPFMSSITPNLRGDIKTNFNHFLLEPVTRISLSNSKSSRNFWVYINPQKIWSATGVSKDTHTSKNDKFHLEAGLLWQKITRQNKKIGLRAEITSFVPATNEPVEIMQVKITNISSQPIKFIPTASIPIYARSLDNLFDHRHVTSLFNRIEKEKFAVIVRPTLSFAESGHKKNYISYFVFGISQDFSGPEYIYPTQEEFSGDNSDLEAPKAIYQNLLPDKKYNPQGKEAMGGLRFKSKTLKPKASSTYIILMGITNQKSEIKSIFNKFNTLKKVEESLAETKKYWQKKSAQLQIKTNDKNFDNWFRWVNIQPVLRRIYGCSFLPDFDYGKGGRGWRDLWQDCLPLILTNPSEVRSILINNFKGVRIDGSNATIIGQKPGEFIADRNNISRVWMDHGIWPLIATHLYIHQSADFNIFFAEIPYFRDHQLCRAGEIDYHWTPDYGKELKTRKQKIYKGSVLEHILVQNLVQFFNVGPHNHIRLENADWNDGLDMAQECGESVAFSAMYAKNLKDICEILERVNQKKIAILKELGILLDTLRPKQIDYSNVNAKQRLLNKYFNAVKYEISGEKIFIPTAKLILDLKKKADWITKHIQKTEWLAPGFFNGYYDNTKQRVEGKIKGILHMTLTGQALPIMSGIATDEQIKTIFKNVKKCLRDSKLGGFHLNTDFQAEQLNLGRAFSFVYGDKENGAFFNHMIVMFASALYIRGFVQEGYAVINSIYKMCSDTQRSKIYPGIPEYFNADGRGLYCYLTGSASWFILTLLTQVFGIRAEFGDLIIEPKLVSQQFKNQTTLSVKTAFAERPIEVSFINPQKKDFGNYAIKKISINGKLVTQNANKAFLSLKRRDFLSLTNSQSNIIKVILD